MSEEQEAKDMNRRIELSMAVGRYLGSVERFDRASKDFTQRCKELREKLKPGERFVAKIDWLYYIVEMDNDGNFEVTKADII